MAVKKRGLGRGLDALLGGATANTLQKAAVQADVSELQHLTLDCIQRGKYQPRVTWIPAAWKSWRSRLRLKG